MDGHAPAWPTGTGLEVDRRPLDGRCFQVEVRRPGARPTAERLLFREGRFYALECAFDGFAPAEYEACVGAWGVGFASETESATDGRLRWEGRIVGDRVVGTVLWTREGHAPVRGTFSGDAR